MATLYLNGHETEVKLVGRTIEVTRYDEANDDIATMKVPLFDLDRVVVVGRPSITIPMLQSCAREAIPVAFTTTRGRWVGNFLPDTNGHALRRLRHPERFSRTPHHRSRSRLTTAGVVVHSLYRANKAVYTVGNSVALNTDRVKKDALPSLKDRLGGFFV